MRRKLLIYSHLWAPTVGGVQIVTMDLAQGICEWSSAHPDEAWEITVVTQSSGEDGHDTTLGFRVVRGPSAWQLFKLIRSADILHLAGPALLPLAIGWLLRKRFVIVHHGYQSICPNGLLLRGAEHEMCPGHFMAGHYMKCIQCNAHRTGLMKSLRDMFLTFPRRWLAARATANVAVSRHLANRLQLPRTQTIYNSARLQSDRSTEDMVPSDREGSTFAFVGRLVAEKGVPVLLKAVSILQSQGEHVRVIVIGDGPERAHLEALAKDLRLQDCVKFFGAVEKERLSSLLARVRAVVMPSVCEDVAPLVLIEQLGDGNLVIGSDIGGLGEFLEGKGLKFPPGDADSLAEIMRRVVHDPRLGMELVAIGKRTAIELFSPDRMIHEHVSLYKDLLSPRPVG
ncbi:MAG TPA: glycosyltransferase family 4 protein [Candidatus Acidoferrum sp.]|nr:glycosyltransferase family 4 protein [Candidatus Acidoferrum sp.]